MIEALLDSGCGVAVVDLWGGGENNLRFSNDNDNYYSRSLMWLGKTLQGKWVEDFRMVEKFLKALLGKEVKFTCEKPGDLNYLNDASEMCRIFGRI